MWPWAHRLRRRVQDFINPPRDRVNPVELERTPEFKNFLCIQGGHCPKCASDMGFYEGPSDGISVSIFCRNRYCRQFYNISPMVGVAVELVGQQADMSLYRPGTKPNAAR